MASQTENLTPVNFFSVTPTMGSAQGALFLELSLSLLTLLPFL